MSAADRRCLACGYEETTRLLGIERVPVLINEICRSREDAVAAPTAPIELAYCPHCGHVFNAAFDGELIHYGPDYENSLHHSARFQEYAASLVRSLAQRHDLKGRTVVEIGCGDGRVLRELCALTGARGFGFDPSVQVPGPADERVTLSRESYLEAADVPAADLVINRHVLEHVEDPRGFLAAIGARAGEGAALYLEVPNALYTLRDLGIWDLIYEHPSYFTSSSLARVVDAAGIAVRSIEEAFAGQFLGLHGVVGRPSSEDVRVAAPGPDLQALAEGFAAEYEQKVRSWSARLAPFMEGEGAGRVALWGAGSKGSTFLNVLGGAGS
ncbi:MAG: class I SAM-dependent methyltransferase, partial [Planctomycetota bacterium]